MDKHFKLMHIANPIYVVLYVRVFSIETPYKKPNEFSLSIALIVLQQWLMDLSSNILNKENATQCICKHYLVHTGMYFLLNACAAFSVVVPIQY